MAEARLPPVNEESAIPLRRADEVEVTNIPSTLRYQQLADQRYSFRLLRLYPGEEHNIIE